MLSLTPGTRLLRLLTTLNPGGSVAHWDARTLERIQRTPIPDRGPVSLVLGRPRRDVRISTGSCGTAGGPLPVRIYTPGAPGPSRPLVVAFHGGGWTIGSARMGDWMNSIVAHHVGAVVSVEYRLAPRHPFPAAVEDCWAALLWAVAHAGELGADPARLAVMGESAGGNLAAVVALLARDGGGPRIAHQTLIYPAVDLSGAHRDTASYRANTDGILLTAADLEAFLDHYLPDGVDRSDWRASPLLAPDLTGLPPAAVVLAGLDVLHDTGLAYARRLADAGVPVDVADDPRMPHGFLNLPGLSRGAGPALAQVVLSQRRTLARPGTA